MEELCASLHAHLAAPMDTAPGTVHVAMQTLQALRVLPADLTAPPAASDAPPRCVHAHLHEPHDGWDTLRRPPCVCVDGARTQMGSRPCPACPARRFAEQPSTHARRIARYAASATR
jgi:hypothetical protein